eukprot:CFRG5237T1
MREHNRRIVRPLIITEYESVLGTTTKAPGAFVLNRSVSVEHLPSGMDTNVDQANCDVNQKLTTTTLHRHMTKNTHLQPNKQPLLPKKPSTFNHNRVYERMSKSSKSSFPSKTDGADTESASSWDIATASTSNTSLAMKRYPSVHVKEHRFEPNAIPPVTKSWYTEVKCVGGKFVTINYTDTTRALTNPPCENCGVLARKSKCRFDNCGDCCHEKNNPCRVHKTKAYKSFLELKEVVRKQRMRIAHGICLLYQAGQCRKGSSCYYDHGVGPEVGEIDFEIGTPIRIKLKVRDYPNMSDRTTYNDKMSLPQSVLMTALAKEISSPYAFRVNKLGITDHSHGGVWEFTAPVNCVLMTPMMQARLAVMPGDTVELTSVRLPRGTFAKFKALDQSAWRRIPLEIIRPLLEFELRKHQTLSVGNLVDVVFSDKRCQLQVMDCKPGYAVSLIDTELAFDIDTTHPTTMLGMGENTANVGNGTELLPGQRTHGMVGAGKSTNLVLKIESGEHSKVITMKLDTTDSASSNIRGQRTGSQETSEKQLTQLVRTDMLISQVEPQPSLVAHTWATAGASSQSISICTACDPNYHYALGSIYVTVNGYAIRIDKGEDLCERDGMNKSMDTDKSVDVDERVSEGGDMHEIAFEFSTSFHPTTCGGNARDCPIGSRRKGDQRTTEQDISSVSLCASLGENRSEPCGNCGLIMPVPRLISHERHCKKNTYKCEDCNVNLPRETRVWHEVTMHVRVACRCKDEFSVYELLHDHVREECPKRMIKCSHLGCLLLTTADSHGLHIDECGSVTISCPVCKENVRRADAQFHMEALHGIGAEDLKSGMALEDQVNGLVAAGKVYGC